MGCSTALKCDVSGKRRRRKEQKGRRRATNRRRPEQIRSISSQEGTHDNDTAGGALVGFGYEGQGT